jgi:hypothetical protein
LETLKAAPKGHGSPDIHSEYMGGNMPLSSAGINRFRFKGFSLRENVLCTISESGIVFADATYFSYRTALMQAIPDPAQNWCFYRRRISVLSNSPSQLPALFQAKVIWTESQRLLGFKTLQRSRYMIEIYIGFAPHLLP